MRLLSRVEEPTRPATFGSNGKVIMRCDDRQHGGRGGEIVNGNKEFAGSARETFL